jgi:hypothetical protein
MAISDDVFKENLIAIVKHHKKHCKHNSCCGVSLLTLRFWSGEHGIKFTKDETELFC